MSPPRRALAAPAARAARAPSLPLRLLLFAFLLLCHYPAPASAKGGKSRQSAAGLSTIRAGLIQDRVQQLRDYQAHRPPRSEGPDGNRTGALQGQNFKVVIYWAPPFWEGNRTDGLLPASGYCKDFLDEMAYTL